MDRAMTPDELQVLLKHNAACGEATKWCKGRTLREAWQKCERGDWMLWFAQMLEVDCKLIALADATVVNHVSDTGSAATLKHGAGLVRDIIPYEIVEACCG